MKNKPRVFVLCNSAWAIPAIDELFQANCLAGIGVLQKKRTVINQLQSTLPEVATIITPLHNRKFPDQLKDKITLLKPDTVFVITFPYRIPADILALPAAGIFNFHFGPLPTYAGNNPIFWQIKNREPYVGITVHRMDENIDTGPIAKIEFIPLSPQDTFGKVCINFSFLAVKLVKEMVDQLGCAPESLHLKPQQTKELPFYADPQKEDITIHWHLQEAASVIALVNAANPWNKGALTSVNGLAVRILEASPVFMGDAPEYRALKPGTVIALDNEKGLLVKCCDGKILRIDILYTDMGFIQGKKLMLLGIKKGDCFGTC